MADKKIVEPGAERRIFIEEVLESVWEQLERGEVTLASVVADVGNEPDIVSMEADGLIRIQEGKITFTEEGEKVAADVTRRHRLAERMFYDVLDLKDFEDEACRFEHAISREVEEAICTFLGHPPTCPHGKPIPRGECCRLYTRKVRPLVSSLKDMEVGSFVKVVFISSSAMDRLSSIGLIPGAVVKLQQKKPSYVLAIDETTIAVDEEIAKGIYVKKV